MQAADTNHPGNLSAVQRDIRYTAVFQDAHRLFEEIYRPGQAYLSDMADLQPSTEASRLLFSGTFVEDLAQPAVTRICEIDLATAAIRTMTSGPNSDWGARISSDGTVAFLSDRAAPGDFQLYFLDMQTQAVTAGPVVDGWVEYLEWAPGGRRILLGVAGHGCELPSGRGAYKTPEIATDEPSWMPTIMGGTPDSQWRKAWIYDLDSGDLSLAHAVGNVWEASWLGEDRLVIVTSDEPEEGAWYDARLAVVDLATGDVAALYSPTAQIAWPRASASGRYLAFIEAISSDREFVAGDLRLFDLRDCSCRIIPTALVDTTSCEWRTNDHLLVAGHRGLETVVLGVGASGQPAAELWQSTQLSTAGRYASVIGLPGSGNFACVCEGFFQRPQIATVIGGTFRVWPAASASSDMSDASGHAEAVNWQAPDGLQLEGWLLRPRGPPPYATILEIHGGPVLAWRPFWIGRAASTLLLLRRGYAIFFPNPRGSSGRGQDFAARVLGDVGGVDTADFLSGIDHLTTAGIADAARLGVTGLSYGGFMTCWLTTQDHRFGAAISVGPATNHVSHHLLCNIPQFVSLFVQDHYTDLGGRYYARSPVLQAHRSTTPTMLVAGDLDRCTPAEEAIQFHNALQEHGTASVVVRYPEEGHGVHAHPAMMDFAARCVTWFERYIPRNSTAPDKPMPDADLCGSAIANV